MESFNNLELNDLLHERDELVRSLQRIEEELENVTMNHEIHLRTALRIAHRALFPTRH